MWQAHRNARNAEALERVCPSLAQGRKGGATSVSADSSAQLSSALLADCRSDWLKSKLAEDGLQYFYGNCTNQGLLKAKQSA